MLCLHWKSKNEWRSIEEYDLSPLATCDASFRTKIMNCLKTHIEEKHGHETQEVELAITYLWSASLRSHIHLVFVDSCYSSFHKPMIPKKSSQQAETNQQQIK